MRYLGLDLGIKSLGIAVSDKTNSMATPLKVINFAREDYEDALSEVMKVINEYGITKVVLGLPKNMDGSVGFAGNRSLNFKKMLEDEKIEVILIDERLTTVSALNIIHENNEHVKETKHKIDAIAASIILESYLRMDQNGIKK